MPVVGSETGQVRSFGEIPNIPERYQAASRRGIHFFELRYYKPIYGDQTIFGPLDVKCKEDWNSMTGSTQFHIKWLKDNDAHIRYVPDAKGVAVAWMPDDKFWRNRVYIMDTPDLYRTLFAYHTANGQFPGTTIRREIDCLREVLKEEKPLYVVLANGRKMEQFLRKEDAEIYINEQSEVKHQIDRMTGQVKQITNKAKFQIVEGKTLDYKDWVKDMIKRENGRHEFSWVQSEDFEKKVRPQVLKLIKERVKADAPQGDKRAEILEVLKSLSDAEKAELISRSAPTVPKSNHEDVTEEGDPNPPVDYWEKRPKSHYRKMKKPELVEIYSGRGFDPSEMTFIKLVDALIEQDEKEPEVAQTLEAEEVVT